MISVYKRRVPGGKTARFYLCDTHAHFERGSAWDGYASRGTCDVCENRYPGVRVYEVDDRKVLVRENTEILVQVGKGPKGSYKTRYSFRGNLGQAFFYYDAINIGLGYKKRLLIPNLAKPVIARAFS